MSRRFTQLELEAYLEEALAPEEMVEIETALRNHSELAQQLATINARRDAGIHSLGEIWRRHGISCPSREHLGSYLLGALSEEHADYIAFHIENIVCRLFRANLEDLQRKQAEVSDTVVTRRQKYFQSTAGHLRGKSQ